MKNIYLNNTKPTINILIVDQNKEIIKDKELISKIKLFLKDLIQTRNIIPEKMMIFI